MSAEWRVVTVAGVGLIGGSFALALRQAGFAGKIIGVSSPATVKAALERGAIDEALPLAEAASNLPFQPHLPTRDANKFHGQNWLSFQLSPYPCYLRREFACKPLMNPLYLK